MTEPSTSPGKREGHGGDLAVTVAQAHGVNTLSAISGAHVFAMYDGALTARWCSCSVTEQPGTSLMDVDTLARRQLPVVTVVGNNSRWAREKHPMRFLHGSDVAAELAPQTPYEKIAQVLGADAETVTGPQDIGAALHRASASGAPYLINVTTGPEAAYPRTTTGV